MDGFNRNGDSSTLAFVISCNLMGAISFKEFKEYFYCLIRNNDINKIPLFIWDLIDLEESERFLIYNVLGFTPSSGLNSTEKDAIYGIAIQRFKTFFDIPISEGEALTALKENPHILDRFKKTFPFIKM